MSEERLIFVKDSLRHWLHYARQCDVRPRALRITCKQAPAIIEEMIRDGYASFSAEARMRQTLYHIHRGELTHAQLGCMYDMRIELIP